MVAELPKPDAGRIPAVVARWAPALQVEWFARYGEQLVATSSPEGDPEAPWDVRAPRLPFEDFYITSTQHRGCCSGDLSSADACCLQSPKSQHRGVYYRA